jgi:hypothetical protein
MADIFISYAREDVATAERLARYLERRGWTVWWDRRILAGKEFDEVIESEIQAAGCVIVIWTQESVKSRWVKVEAGEAHKREILVPVVVDGCTPPLAFRNVQSVALTQQVDHHAPELRSLIDAITQLVGRRDAVRTVASPIAPPPVNPIGIPPLAVTEPPDAVAARTDVGMQESDTESTEPSPVIAAPRDSSARSANTRRLGILLPLGGLALLAALWIGTLFYSGTEVPSPQSQAPSATPSPTSTFVAPGPSTAPTPTPSPSSVSDSETDSATLETIQSFVNTFLSTISSSNIADVLDFYADQVDYYDKGRVGRAYIRQDKGYYFKRWPVVSQTLQGDVTVRNGTNADTKVVTYTSRYSVASPARNTKASGTITTTLVLINDGKGFKITNQKEVSRADRK